MGEGENCPLLGRSVVRPGEAMEQASGIVVGIRADLGRRRRAARRSQ